MLRRLALFGLMALAAGAGEAPARVRAVSRGDAWRTGEDWTFRRELFFAVLEGLYKDGVSNDVVDHVLEQAGSAHFVAGCPLCTPAHDAFATYRERAPFRSKVFVNTFGSGLDPDLNARLLFVDRAVCMPALEELVRKWVREYMDARRLTEDERARWSHWMENGRKRGMQSLRAAQQSGLTSAWDGAKGCAVCDGANGACKR